MIIATDKDTITTFLVSFNGFMKNHKIQMKLDNLIIIDGITVENAIVAKVPGMSCTKQKVILIISSLNQ